MTLKKRTAQKDKGGIIFGTHSNIHMRIFSGKNSSSAVALATHNTRHISAYDELFSFSG